jgi:type IV pilus assembly protein PilB
MRLGEFLVDKNIVSHADLSRALTYQENWGGRLGEALISLRILTEDKLLAALKYHLELPVVNLEQLSIPREVVKLIPKETARKFKVVPVKVGEVGGKRALFVAMNNPLDLTAIEEVQFAAGMKVQPVLSREKGFLYALKHYYDIDVGYISPKGEGVPLEPKEDAMTIIRSGEEVQIEDGPEIVGESLVDAVIEKRKAEETAPPAPEQSEKRVLQALIRLLIEKEYITLDELREKMSGK